MKKDVHFVTSVYDDLHQTEFAGRHNRGTHYAFSLAQMHYLGAPVLCYTDRTNLHRFLPALMHHGIDNFQFYSYNLDESPYTERIQTLKNAKPEMYKDTTAWKNRCVEIMWGKFDLILDAVEKVGIADDRYLYWIDAGLSHPGVIPIKYNTKHSTPGVVWGNAAHDYNTRFEMDKIFNDQFPDFLAEYTGESKLMHFFCRCPQHSDKSHLAAKKTYVGSAVGGLFGGDVQMMQAWATQGKAVCDDLLTNGYLITEEDILSHMINFNVEQDESFAEKLTLYKFDTWYHEDWEKVYDPSRQESFSDFFELFEAYKEDNNE